jgi:polar amino acid transport system ATP-binding protein
MPEGEAVVRVRDVIKEFGPLRVLDGVGFEVTREGPN